MKQTWVILQPDRFAGLGLALTSLWSDEDEDEDDKDKVKDNDKYKEKDKDKDYHMISPAHYEDEVERYTVCLDKGCKKHLKCVSFLLLNSFCIAYYSGCDSSAIVLILICG